MLLLIIYTLTFFAILGAWISGALDPYQKRMQEIVLDRMGETKVPHPLKKSLVGKQLIEDENLNKIQDRLGEEIKGVFGKGGAGATQRFALLVIKTHYTLRKFPAGIT
ncbi:hypothetical protein DTO027B5_3146 [Paecilomyces variotii]|nr:hypothetical protein DTO021C3_7115 [Paecilomyces variotii]KAJ9323128.1 hypothetical protein DTO027B3_5922 [Paecilomyces variotii]KAJ9335183.1 hypothetical protein DTO027B5_3146 [Paecilomyces variotii]